MKDKINYWAILVFYVIAIGCRFVMTKTDILKEVINPHIKILLYGIGPALGTLIVFKLFSIKPILTLRGNYKKLLTPVLIYWGLPVLLISSITFIQKGSFPGITVFVILFYGLLEEIGWRGFLYQNLKSIPLFYNILIVSILWFVWHLNFDLTLSNLFFFGIILLGSWGIGKVSDLTHSLFAVSAFHSLNNFFADYDYTKLLVLSILLVIWIGGLLIRKQLQLNIS